MVIVWSSSIYPANAMSYFGLGWNGDFLAAVTAVPGGILVHWIQAIPKFY